MNWLPKLVVNRPVMTIMVMLIILLVGLGALTSLPVELFPRMNFPVAVAVVSFDGASPQEVEDLVVKPLEDSLSTANNVKKVSSESREDMGIVIVEFNWGTDMDMATLQMRERIDRIKGRFPDGAGSPLVMKFDPSARPVITLAVSGKGDSASIRKLAEDIIKPRLERLDGVSSVSVAGGDEREVRVEVDSQRLQAYNMSLDTVIQALRARNVNVSAGTLPQGKGEFLLRSNGQFRSVEEIRNLALTGPQGTVVFLKDIAEVKDTYKDKDSYTRMNRNTSVGMSVLKQTESNAVDISDKVHKEIEKLKPTLPPGTEIGIVMDQADFIKVSIRNVLDHTVQGGLLAMVVIFLFLRSIPSTLVIASAIPISLLGAFALMHFSGLTLNMLSLGGLALGVGRLVDDAIVVLENIFRHREAGESPRQAAINGSAEVLSAITGVTLTTVAVFFPITFTEGLTGELFGEMALSVTFALLASLFVAMTLIPLLSSLLLSRVGKNAKTERHETQGRSRMQETYYRALGWALGRRGTVVLISVGAFIGSLFLIPLVGAEFMPKMDRGEMQVTIKLPRGTQLEETNRLASQVEGIILKMPEVEAVFTRAGGSNQSLGPGVTGKDAAQIDVKLVKQKDRDRSLNEVMEDLRQRFAAIPGAKITVQASGGMSGGGSDSPITIHIKGEDIEQLDAISRRVAERVKAVPDTREVETSTGEALPELRFTLNQEKVASLGLSAAQVGQSLRSAMEGVVATRYHVGGDDIDIRVRLDQKSRANEAELLQTPVKTPMGLTLPLGELGHFEPTHGPVAIQRDGQVRVVAVTGDITGRSLREIMQDIQTKLSDIKLPPGYSIDFAGEQEQMRESFGSLGKAFIMALLLVYMILAAEFESLIQPLTIMTSVPLGLIGAILGLLFTGHHLNIASLIGVIMLSGIAVSNAIVLVDYIIALRNRGVERTQAIREAGAVRLRPVLMTALSTILALLPLALGVGEGSEFQAPMAVVVLFGLLVSTVLTLVVVPVIYSFFDDLSKRFSRKKGTPVERGSGPDASFNTV